MFQKKIRDAMIRQEGLHAPPGNASFAAVAPETGGGMLYSNWNFQILWLSETDV